MTSKAELTKTRREQILEAATSVFARLGVHKARMDDIVAEAGLSKGAVYWYFKSKDEIIKSILDWFLGRELVEFQELLKQEGSVRDRFITMIHHLITELEQYSKAMPIAYEFYALSTRESYVRKALYDYYHQYLWSFEELLKQGINRGEFREVDANRTAVSIIALLEGLTLLWVIGVLQADIKELLVSAESGLTLILDGLKAGKD